MSGVMAQAAFWPVAIPLAAAALAAMLWTRPRLQRVMTGLAVVLMVVASALLLILVEGQGPQAVRFGDWPVPFGIVFVADRLAAAMVAITALLALVVAIFARAEIRRRREHAGFHPLLLGMLAAVNGAFLTGDLFNLYVWFEVMLVAAMGLLVLDRTRAQLDGTFRYAVLNLLGTLMFLLAVAIVYGSTGSLNMADLALRLPVVDSSAALAIATALFLTAFGIKAAYFPLFFWLPASYHTAPITVSTIFAGLLTKVGVYACFRVFTLFLPLDAAGLRELTAVMAAGTMLFGVFGAAIQWDVRRILSFHIISQIGYMLLGLAVGTPAAMAGAIFYVIHHIIVKANLFLVAGAMYRAGGTFDLRRLGGLRASHPLLALLFLIPALSLAGIPPLSGFWAKYMVIEASFTGDAAWLGAVGLFVGLLTLYSMSKIWIYGFWKPPRAERSRPRRVPITMLAATGLLGAVTLLIGLAPEAFVHYSALAADALVDPASYIAAVFGPEAAAAW